MLHGNAATRQRGVALLFAVLMTSMLFLVALSISNVAYKQLLFSGEARESDHAFFAADTGVECGMYLDSAPRNVFTSGSMGTNVCAGITPLLTTITPTKFSFVLPLSPTSCTLVNVDKNYDALGTGTSSYTSISAVGYNVGGSSTDPTVCVSSGLSQNIVTRELSYMYDNTSSGTTGTTGTTSATVPVLTDSIDPSAGQSLATLVSDGGSTLTDSGIDFSVLPTTPGITVPFSGTYGYHLDCDAIHGSACYGSYSTYGIVGGGLPLTGCSTVYSRAWASNSMGTGYSAPQVLNVECATTVPTVTATIDSTGLTTATLISNGGSSMINAGIDYSVYPTTPGITVPFSGTYDYHMDMLSTAGAPPLVGHEFSTYGFPGIPVTECSTVYARSWGSNSVGTGYSSLVVINASC